MQFIRPTHIFHFLLFLLATFSSKSQGTFIPNGNETYFMLGRLEVLGGQIWDPIHSAVKPFNRNAVQQHIRTLYGFSSSLEKKYAEYILHNSPEFEPDIQSLFKSKKLQNFGFPNAGIFIKKGEDFLAINPVFELGTMERNFKVYPMNTRGVEIRGSVNEKLGYYTFLSENQIWLPDYIMAFKDTANGALPGSGLIKKFKANQFNNAFDFFNSRAHISFNPLKSMEVQFGNDQMFIGNGIRSLIWSDFSKDFLALRLITRIKKVQYTNVFARLNDFKGQIIGRFTIPKYAAFHHLSINIGKKLNIGFFENIIFNRNDTMGGSGYDISYLNPVIFYRSVEHNLNSADNAFIGTHVNWILTKGMAFYGQFILDEFILRKFIARKGDWQNKNGIQLGMKYFNVAGVQGLDMQVEWNQVRPYTYSHFLPSSNYSHYGQPLAHPLGANFREWVGQIRFQPTSKLWFTTKAMYVMQGLDTGNANWGSRIDKDNHTRMRVIAPYYSQGHFSGQGIKSQTIFIQASLSYCVFHQIWLDFGFMWRKQWVKLKSEFNREEHYAFLRLRMNIPQKESLY